MKAMLYHQFQADLYQKALKEKGIDQMITEARESTTPETDAEHLRR